jgi:hypothetical protein
VIIHLLNLLTAILSWTILVGWFSVGNTADLVPRRWQHTLATIFFETRWAWPFCCAWSDFISPTLSGNFGWWSYLQMAVDGFVWWAMAREKDDDDRWRRRGKRALEAVRAAGHRLVVVPA